MEQSIPEVAYYKPITESNINLIHSITQGEYLQTNLYYHSESWMNLIRPDVDNLLLHFSSGYLNQFDQDGDLTKKESPFELFKRKWIELGWSNIHLLGVPDGRMRGDWSKSIIRTFLEHIKLDEEPLRQIGALFALYTFYFTQARTLDKSHISIDSATLDYILAIPDSLDSALTPSVSSSAASTSQTLLTPDTTFSYDLHQIIYSLLSRDAFFIIPTENYLFPLLPSVYIRDGNESELKETAKLVLGVEEELKSLARGQVKSVISTNNINAMDDMERDYLKIESQWKEDSGWSGNLKEMREEYLVERRKRFSTVTSVPTNGKRKRDATGAGITESITRGMTESEVRLSTITQAQNLTSAALKDATTAGEGSSSELSRTGLDTGEFDLFDLVGREGDGSIENGLMNFQSSLKEFNEANGF